jgi:hypothetical protein
MIKYIVVITFLLSSCGNLPITYAQNFSDVNNVIFGFPEYEITEEIYDEYEFSFAKVQFDRGPHSILILAYIDGGIYEWVGADNVKLFTKNGRVIKTSGLRNDFEIKSPYDPLSLEIVESKFTDSYLSRLTSIFLSENDTTSYYEIIDLYNPDLINATLSTTYVSSSDTIMRFGKKKDVLLIKQYAEIDSIAWKEENMFHVDPGSKKVIQSSQILHPRLSRVNIEFYYKF